MATPKSRVVWRHQWRLTGDPVDTVTFGETALEACEAMVQIEVQRGISAGPRHGYVTDPFNDPNTLKCSSNSSWLLPVESGHELGPLHRTVTYYPDYPADGLPCPKSIVTVPAERRLLSDMAGARQSRGLQREYVATERIEWPPLTQEQAERWQEWYLALGDGGGWFFADWPRPQAGAVLRRFVRPPQWDYIHGGTERRMWRIAAECEVREDANA